MKKRKLSTIVVNSIVYLAYIDDASSPEELELRKQQGIKCFDKFILN